jgi:hypothetical protein
VEPHRWSVRVSTGGRQIATAYARAHRFEVGLPLSFDVEYGATTALEQVLGALGADVACGLQRLASIRRIVVDQVEAVVQADLDNPLMHLGVVGEEGSPAIARIEIKLYVGSSEEESRIAELLREVRERSPLLRTFEKTVALDIELRVVV